MPRGAKPKIVEGYPSKKHPLYHTWKAMKQRCVNPNNAKYDCYGGRGISVCDRWLDSFKSFVEDMGPKPEGYSIERRDNDCDYEPDNCKWASHEEQMGNRRMRCDNPSGIANVVQRKDSGHYRVIIERGEKKLDKTFLTIEEALEAKDNFLKGVTHGA